MAIIMNEDIEDYHANPAVSNSCLKDFDQKGALYFKKAHIDRVIDRGITQPLIDGQAFETLLYEGREPFDVQFIERPADDRGDFRKTVGKAWKAEVEAAGMAILDRGTLDRFGAMIKSAHEAAAMLEKSVPELGNIMDPEDGDLQVTLRTSLGKYPLDLQARPDKANWARKYTLDLKTTANFADWWDWKDPANPIMARPVWQYGYHRQASIVKTLAENEGKAIDHSLLLVIEKAEPYRAGIFIMSQEALDIGWKATVRTLDGIAKCHAANEWPNNPPGPVVIMPPAWIDIKDAREFDTVGF